jgi:hypothetical protein
MTQTPRQRGDFKGLLFLSLRKTLKRYLIIIVVNLDYNKNKKESKIETAEIKSFMSVSNRLHKEGPSKK